MKPVKSLYGECFSYLPKSPDSSTKQHLKSDGEGQFHIKNTNLEWHLNSHYFQEWITYKQLFELLENDR